MTERIDRNAMAARIAQDIPEGAFVNLGIGAPTLVANHLPEDEEIILHTENGLLGMGGAPAPDQVDPDQAARSDRKSTRLNSSHVAISYAVFCLKKKITRI